MDGSSIKKYANLAVSCKIDPPTHAVCIGQTCATEVGSGIDECSNNAECFEEQPSHSECINEMCIEVSGSGNNECSTNAECFIDDVEPLDCEGSGNSCIFRSSCEGQSLDEFSCPIFLRCCEVSDIPDEPPVVFHAECIGNTCVEVSGPGITECANLGASCNIDSPTHAVCIGQTCATKVGSGINECFNNIGCIDEQVVHAE